ncbi:MAG: heavy metal translocating P-type ATPase [Leptospira sp.]|nr:heavy metal translocating P-type ATPase [Leptospira sp.]
MENTQITETTQTTECDHCGNTFRLVKLKAHIEGEEKYFCCEGCETVYSLIRSISGERYYSLKGSQRIEPVDFDEGFENKYSQFDSDAIYEKFVRTNNGLSEVIIQITNIHCSACVWLNEKVLSETIGIRSAQINFASGRAKIVFNHTEIKLSEILKSISQIGYKPQLYSPGSNTKQYKKSLNSLFLRIGVAGFAFGNMMVLSVALYSGYFSGIDTDLKRLFHFVSWFFATPAYLYSGYPFMKGFFHSIKQRTLTMDFLLFFGISLAYFYSVYVTFTDKGEVYFDSVAMIYFFILIGKYFEEKSRLNAAEKLESILCRLPEESIKIINGIETKVKSEDIRLGDRIKILPGMRVPVDGIIESEIIQIDESFLTGESKPITKRKGDTLLAGSLALDSHVVLIATTDYHASTLSSLKLRMEEALLSKPKIQILTEKIASYFISTVFIISLLTLASWLIVTNGNFEKSLIYTISVLIVACPCALGISVPTALVMNHILNSEKGVLLKNPSVVEPLAKISQIFLDKTGTLTEGKFLVREINIDTSFYPLLFALEKQVNHPLAKSIVSFLKPILANAQNYEIPEIHSFKAFPGKGLLADISTDSGTQTVLLGNLQLLNNYQISIPIHEKEGSMVYLAIGGEYKGFILLADALRTESFEFVTKLRKIIPKITILSGDSALPVRLTADTLHINSYFSDLSPEEKVIKIKEARAKGNIVAMVGDGINDSLSLAGADVSISHTEAEDLSLEKADVVLTSGNLNGILYSIHSAKKTRQVILQNIIISLCYNSIMLPLAVFGFMLPVICSIFMAASSLTVLINSLSLRIRIK